MSASQTKASSVFTSKGSLASRRDSFGFPQERGKSPHAKEPVATSYSSPGVLAEAAHKTGRAKADFELREIGREEYERLRLLLHL